MKRSMTVLVAGVVAMLSSMSAHAGLIDFTLANNGFNTAPLSPTYQPVSGVTITYTDISTYNGAPDHTNPGAGTGTNNYFVYPSLGDNNTMTFGFSTNVSIPSFWYDTFHSSGTVIVHAYDASLNDLTGTGIILPPPTPHANGLPTFTLSTALSSYTTVRSVTFTNYGSSDAANIDDITVATVPEPASLVLFGLGAIGLVLAARRRRKA